MGEITVSTPNNEPDSTVSLTLGINVDDDETKAFLEKAFLKELSEGYGFYGHTINLENLNNLDLSAAVRQLESFVFVSQEPEIIKPNPLPEGVQT
jgi:hypothetical protein